MHFPHQWLKLNYNGFFEYIHELMLGFTGDAWINNGRTYGCALGDALDDCVCASSDGCASSPALNDGCANCASCHGCADHALSDGCVDCALSDSCAYCASCHGCANVLFDNDSGDHCLGPL